MAKKIVLGVFAFVVVVIVGLLVAVSMQPSELVVSRSATISASPEAVFPHINNLQNWDAWSPWDKKDPDMKKNFNDTESGEGASYSWDGNDDVGAGSMTIVKSVPNEQVDFHLEFTRPWESECDVDFQLEPAGEGSKITWTMRGENDFMGKLMSMFMDMDAMIGKDFEEGLAGLKEEAEKEGSTPLEEPDPAAGEEDNS